jgi:hypothetical protein
MLPDGRLASGAWDNTIRLWDVTSRGKITVPDVKHHRSRLGRMERKE